MIASRHVQPIRHFHLGLSRIVGFAGIALILGVFTGCGGTDANPKDVLKRTFSDPHSYSSGRLDVRILIDGQGLTGNSGALKVTLKGPFSSNGKGTVPSFRMNTGLGLGKRSVEILVTSNGKRMWIGLAGLEYALPAQVFESFASGWLGGTGSKDGVIGRLGFDPQTWLAHPETVGEESIAGTDTVHVRSKVDGAALISQFSGLLGAANGTGAGLLDLPKLTEQQKSELAKSVKTAQIDVWSAKSDGSLRRLDVTVDVAPTASSRASKLELSLTMSDLNQPQVIETPRKARQFNELSNMIQSFSGAAGANSGSSTANGAQG